MAVPEVSENQAAEKCPEVIKYWKHLASQSVELSDDVELKRNWLQFVKAFGKACNLYHDESHERKPFATVPSIQYPFTVFQTSFYKPQSEFLKRPLRLTCSGRVWISRHFSALSLRSPVRNLQLGYTLYLR